MRGPTAVASAKPPTPLAASRSTAPPWQNSRERAEAATATTAGNAPVAAQSVRNRFTGLVTRVIKDTVMAQVEIQAGPHRFVSLLSREAADELGLEPGMLAVAARRRACPTAW
jgi:molybdopterin-binding protein